MFASGVGLGVLLPGMEISIVDVASTQISGVRTAAQLAVVLFVAQAIAPAASLSRSFLLPLALHHNPNNILPRL